jgi:release factor glutamine methyltransferase
VFAEEEAALLEGAASTPADLESLVLRRIAGEPLEYVVGWVAFDGIRVAVDTGVFVPRQRTAYLVELAALALTAAGTPGTALDLCCGSGALGLALAHRRPGLVLHATDNDPVAVSCASRNLTSLGFAHLGDLDQPLPADLRGTVDVIVANPPYLPAVENEPRGLLRATEAGPDGRLFVDRLIDRAPDHLRPGGVLLVVHSSVNGVEPSLERLERSGLDPDLAARHRGPLGPVLTERAPVLEQRGLLAPGERCEDVVIVRGRVPVATV